MKTIMHICFIYTDELDYTGGFANECLSCIFCKLEMNNRAQESMWTEQTPESVGSGSHYT